MAGTLLIDGRNALDPDAVRAAGLAYEGIGREPARAGLRRRPRLMQAVILVGGRGHAAAAADLDRAQAGHHARRPAVPGLHARVAARATASTTSIMSCGFLADERARGARRRRGATASALRYVVEPEPRGTAGALKFAEELLDERFLMLNGDVLTDVDITRADRPARGDRRDAARSGSSRSTTRRAYGLVALDDDGARHRVPREARAPTRSTRT